ncbi:tRNA-uridine aminocarboxypropyltransferase [Roseimaritima ulvae]|uniref:tRNA-uridine aminocarboxypropyltransferase n=1 Tax=Roseimaritima ulvae TaxID=980254 RepID=A0A5B9QX21_9BACT|nr:tRNA-uridine aminocarboxypropyltransferase [Roseimaritima ulvae]QEG42552.1 DTW domain protein [Roseimaritima ulvae]
MSASFDAHADSHRQRCYGCFRPRRLCFCHAIPKIDNATEVLILQHMRERFHPFNTARIVRRALRNATLLVDHNQRMSAAANEFPFGSQAGILYPSADARVLSELPPEQHPRQLVVIDGTWHHAKTLMRDIPRLQRLPRYCLVPQQPSRYRIRREPTETALSTIEATVQALRTIEPQTAGWDDLLQAFDTMVDQQLAEMGPNNHLRRNTRRRSLTNPNFPRVLTAEPQRVIVAYGESTPQHRSETASGAAVSDRKPILWTAQRPATGERFRCLIQPPTPLSPTVLQHMQLDAAQFDAAVSLDAFADAWREFVREGDTLVVYHMSTARLLTAAGLTLPRCITLKSIQFNGSRPRGTLEEVMQSMNIAAEQDPELCRAARRLQNAIRYLDYLRSENIAEDQSLSH